jgi:hypothetical protein
VGHVKGADHGDVRRKADPYPEHRGSAEENGIVVIPHGAEVHL